MKCMSSIVAVVHVVVVFLVLVVHVVVCVKSHYRSNR